MVTTVVCVLAGLFIFPGQVAWLRGEKGWTLTYRPLWQVLLNSPVPKQEVKINAGDGAHAPVNRLPASNGHVEQQVPVS